MALARFTNAPAKPPGSSSSGAGNRAIAPATSPVRAAHSAITARAATAAVVAPARSAAPAACAAKRAASGCMPRVANPAAAGTKPTNAS